MGLLDSIVSRSFRDDPAGRVVVFGGEVRGRGYLVKSKADELKIKSFIKMFIFAELSIQSLGLWLTLAWIGQYSEARDRAAHLLRAICVFAGVYSVIVIVPLLLLWRSYKKERFSFVSAEDEVPVTSKRPRDQQFFQIIALIAITILVLIGVIFLIRFK
jgi:hypothetical protein